MKGRILYCAAAMAEVVLLSSLLGQSNTNVPSQEKERDLSRYEKGGPFTIDSSVHNANEQPRILSGVREFLWSHWRDRRLSWIEVTSYSIEGLATKAAYYIEPDSLGKWQIVVEKQITLPGLARDGKKHLQEVQRHVFRSMRRVDSASGTALSDREMRAATSFRVQLTDDSGSHIDI